jgi:hypothetical protein
MVTSVHLSVLIGCQVPSAAGRQRPLPRRLVLRLGEPDSVPAAIRVFNGMRHNAKPS